MKKQNCWEFMLCGREPGGHKSTSLGVCPASTFEPFSRLHGGSAAGRVCWAVADTLCSGKASGHFSKKLDYCKRCRFYRRVIHEEAGGVQLTTELLRIIDQRVKERPAGNINRPIWFAEAEDI